MLLLGLTLLAIFTLIAVPTAFAETQHIIEPVKGSGFTGCPLILGCYSPMVTNAQIDDVIAFHNTAFVDHTFTSGTPDEGPSGIFDSGLVLVGSSFEYKADTAGEIPYFCTVHPWMAGLIIVEEQPIDLPEVPESPYDEATILFGTGLLSDGTTVKVYTSESMVGEGLTITVKFVDSMHVNYDLTVMQNGEEFLSDMGAHQHEGKGTHMTAPLGTADPVDVTIIFQGYGVDEITGPTNEEVTFLSILGDDYTGDDYTGDDYTGDDYTGDDYTDLNTIIDQLVELVDELKAQIALHEERIITLEATISTSSDTSTEPEPRTGIQGKTYTDTNNNNRYDAGEPLLSGVSVITINLSDHSDVERGQTDDSGEYFIERDAGSYLVQIEFTNSFGYIDVRMGSVTTQNLGIPSGNTVPETPEPEMPESTEPVFITTDKTAYSLGDTIRVSGFVDPLILHETISDERLGTTTVYPKFTFVEILIDAQNNHFRSDAYCVLLTEDRASDYPDLELGTFYVWWDGVNEVFAQGHRCFDDSGNFSFDFVVNENYYADSYVAWLYIDNTYSYISEYSALEDVSSPFTVG